MEFHPYREQETRTQVERLERIRRERDGEAVREALQRVRQAASSGENVMPAVMDAVEAYATRG